MSALVAGVRTAHHSDFDLASTAFEGPIVGPFEKQELGDSVGAKEFVG